MLDQCALGRRRHAARCLRADRRPPRGTLGSLRLYWTSALWAMSLAELRAAHRVVPASTSTQVRELRRAIGYDAEHVVNPRPARVAGAPGDEVEASSPSGAAPRDRAGVHASRPDRAWPSATSPTGAYDEAFARLRSRSSTTRSCRSPAGVPRLRRGRRPQRADRRALRCVEPARGARGRQRLALGRRAWPARSRRSWPTTPPSRTSDAALAALDRHGVDIDLARAHLLYGEWLRRKRGAARPATSCDRRWRSSSARGAAAFAARAAPELEATGETRRAASRPARRTGLTPRSSTVARLAAAGAHQRRDRRQLFISVNTVDYHLRKVFQKLGITSRRQLADRTDPPAD